MKRVLPVIVLSQFFCTSLWFAVNAIMPAIGKQFHLEPGYIVHLTSAVQFGFITGTLLFAILGIADRFSPSLVFFACAAIAAGINLAIILPALNTTGLLTCRFLTGFFLAGIYPVGMKIAADHYRQGLGKSLGFLVGALVFGTSFPHFLNAVAGDLPWKYIIYTTSSLSLLGGLAMFLFVPDGPNRQPAQKFRFGAFWKGFANKNFRAAALGYFGHMWELYAFWVFVPVMLAAYQQRYPGAGLNISLLSFIIIAAGGVACMLSGLISGSLGVKRTATGALLTSCICCIISPLLLFIPSPTALIVFLFIWSMAVIADSPLFSTLVAQNAPATSKGSSLTIVNCIGFAITIFSIQLINAWRNETNERYIYLLLAIGPILGLIALVRNKE
jgi:MFS family permease